MSAQTHDPVMAYRDDVFLHAHGIMPYFLDELTMPAVAVPQAPLVSAQPVRHAPATDGCLEVFLKVFVVTAGCLLISAVVVAGLMKVAELVISASR